MPAREPTPSADVVEQLLDDIVTLPDTAQAAALARLCAEHADLAEALRARYALFLRIATPGPQSSEPASGPRQFGEYTLLRELGSGGMGVVYLARQHRGEQERLVALKLVRDRLALSPQARERLRREGAAAFRLDHPGICRAYDLGEIDGTPFVSMRYVPGKTLAQLLRAAHDTNRPIEIPADGTDSGPSSSTAASAGSGRVRGILTLIEQVARALHVAHEAGFVHRDVKPGNIMVGDDGAPVLLDFGLVQDQASSQGLTLTDQPLGTPNYMSPEQIAPRGRKLDRTTDVYSLGVTLYELLAGELPFRGTNREELFRQILEAAPQRLSRRVGGISRDLEIVVQTAIDKDPARRYRTALAFAEDLRHARLNLPIVARPAGLIRRLMLWSRRNPLAAVMLGLLALSQALIVVLAIAAEHRAVEAIAAKRLAEENFREASDAITELATVASEQLADVPWLVQVRRALFEKVLAFHERASTRATPDPADRRLAARAWIQSAHLQEDLGHNDEAEQLLQRALATLREDDDPWESRRWIASARILLANLAQKRGDAVAAEASLREAIVAIDGLEQAGLAQNSDRARIGNCHYELAELLLDNLGRSDDALAAIEACLRTVGPLSSSSARVDEAAALRLRARLARREEHEEAALADLGRSVELMRSQVSTQAHDRTARASLATSLISLGLAQKEFRQNQQAKATYEEALAVYADLIAAFPFHLHYRINQGQVHNNLAVLQRATGDAKGSRESLLRALEIGREALRLEPESTFAKNLVIDSAYNLANQTRREDPAGAEALYRECLDHLEAMLAKNTDNVVWLDLASRTNNSLGALLATQQQFEAALTAFQRARQVTEQLLATQTPTPRMRRNAAILNYNTGSMVCETTGDLPAAIECLRTAVRHSAQVAADDPANPLAIGLELAHRVRLATLVEMHDKSCRRGRVARCRHAAERARRKSASPAAERRRQPLRDRLRRSGTGGDAAARR